MKTKICLILTASVFLLLLTAVNPTLAQHRARHLPFNIERLERRAVPSIVTAAKTETAIENSSPAAAGDLDAGFGNGGIVATPITNSPYYDSPSSMQVQPDGKIVVCGEILEEDSTVSFFLTRYNPTGTLDTSFGTNGKVIAPLPFDGEYVGKDIALQPDGKIVAVGFKWNMSSSYDFAVNRYNANGTLDTSFGTGGKVVTPVGISFEFAHSVAVQPDGKIVVAGYSFLGGNDFAFAVVRYNPDGTLDNSFGAGGKIITAIGSNYVLVSAVILQPNGKIVVVGASGTDNNFTLVRYNADGSLDSEFGSNGKVIHRIENGPASFFDGILQPDGKIVAAGDSNGSTAIVRYNANGSMDTSFAANGIFRTEDGFYVGNGLALQPDGKILAFGSGGTASVVGFAVARLNPNGSPDATFGTNGRLITPIGTNNFSSAVAGALQADGKILAFGETFAPDYSNSDIAIVRYLGDSASPNPIDDAQFFVRQHYLDFLNRQPDPDGLAFWTSEITLCGADQQCIEAKRVNVSAAFFLSTEFQQTGYLVYRIYKASYGDLPGTPVPVRLSEFLPDTQQIGQGVVVNQTGWEQVLENNKQAFAADFVARSRFTSAFPTSMTPGEFVDTLFANAGVTPPAGDRMNAVNEFGSATSTSDTAARARALRRAAENSTLTQQEFNRAFVLMQYFGYLRRNPNDPPEATLDFQGYNFWLNKLNQFNGDFVHAEMVRAFLVSSEYRQRFGS